MSMDRSLRSKATLARHRNVLSRAERISRLKDADRWKEEDGILGLPKVGNIKPRASKKKAKEEAGAEGTAAAPGTAAPAAGAAAPAAAAGAKPAAGAEKKPAAGGKK